LARGEALGQTSGPYLLQAAIAACHARAPVPADTDWNLIAKLYEMLSQLNSSPVVELNRAVAVAMSSGPEAALEIVDRLDAQGSLRSYHLLPSVRADLLQKLGRFSEAQIEFEHAATLTRNERERRLLSDRADACKQGRF
jgi:predicted RNA polymerase sigma factor